MEREQIKEVIAKYKKMSNQFLRYGEDKCYEYGSIAEAIEENFEEYLDELLIGNGAVRKTLHSAVANLYVRSGHKNIFMLVSL